MQIRSVGNFEQWRTAARGLLAAGVLPRDIEWADHGAVPARVGIALADVQQPPSAVADGASGRPAVPMADTTRLEQHRRPLQISAALLRLLESVAVHCHPGRWELMYRLVWRSMAENSRLLEDAADPDVHSAELMAKAVARDVHKMHAFVRFRAVADAHGETSYFAWFEPEHLILRRGAAFFVKRFPNMHWAIATPQGAALWAGHLRFIEAPDAARLRSENRQGDDYENLWRTYYRSICNVARINPAAMQREMPQRYWKHLPEAAEIGLLIRDGVENFVARHHESPNEGAIMPKAVRRSLPTPSADENPQTCRRCDLWRQATQAVVGQGEPGARIMLVGEQPGDEEDLRGHPFVGPAGKVLDQALAAVGIDRRHVFITNAVKHFKWEPRGKRRLHKKPGAAEINACTIWLEREIAAVKPAVIVALGATALRALTGASVSIEAARQQQLSHPGGAVILATYHPSALLRAEGERVDELRRHLEADLRRAAQSVSNQPGTDRGQDQGTANR